MWTLDSISKANYENNRPTEPNQTKPEKNMAEYHQLPPFRKTIPRPANNNSTDDGEEIIIPEFLWKQYEDEAEQLARTISRSSDLTAQVPSLDHTKCRDFDNVYEPSDDTFLLLDAIQYDLLSSPSSSSSSSSSSTSTSTSTTMPNSSSLLSCVMEVGTGSGVPITFLVKNLEKRRIRPAAIAVGTEETSRNENIRAIATDINPAALRLAQRTAQENGLVSKMDETVQTDITVRSDHDGDDHDDNANSSPGKIRLEFVRCDLATPFLKDLEHQVDCLIFNPPYVPTPDSEVVDGYTTNVGDIDTTATTTTTIDETKLIEASWAGGERGRRVVDRFVFQQLPKLLSKNKTNEQDDDEEDNNNVSNDRSSGGVAYMVTVDDNEPYELACLLLSNFGLRMKPLVRRRARNEYLTIQKITWADDEDTTEKKKKLSK